MSRLSSQRGLLEESMSFPLLQVIQHIYMCQSYYPKDNIIELEYFQLNDNIQYKQGYFPVYLKA